MDMFAEHQSNVESACFYFDCIVVQFFVFFMSQGRTFVFWSLLFICTRRASNPAMSNPRRRLRRSSTGSSSSKCRVAGLLYPLLGACLWASVVGYKPVVIIHGLFDSSGDFKNLLRFINQVSDCGDGEWICFPVFMFCVFVLIIVITTDAAFIDLSL